MVLGQVGGAVSDPIPTWFYGPVSATFGWNAGYLNRYGYIVILAHARLNVMFTSSKEAVRFSIEFTYSHQKDKTRASHIPYLILIN